MCKAKKVGSIKAEGVQISTSTSKLTVNVKGAGVLVPIEVEADTGANISVAKADILRNGHHQSFSDMFDKFVYSDFKCVQSIHSTTIQY